MSFCLTGAKVVTFFELTSDFESFFKKKAPIEKPVLLYD